MSPDTVRTATAPARSRSHRVRWIAGSALVIAAGLVAVLATRPPASVALAGSPLLGKPAPPVTASTLTGSHFARPAAPGHYVVLNFFASWCVPCQQEGPDLVRFAFEHSRTGDAQLVSVAFEDSASSARSYQAQLGATWPTLSDPGGNIALDYGVYGLPSTFLIAPDGRVVAHAIAPVTSADLDQLLAQARASRP